MSVEQTKKNPMQLVDGKTVRAKKVNREISKKVFGKNNRALGESDWDFIPRFIIDFLHLVSNILYIPVVLIIAILEGIRCGFIRGMEKALAMYRVTS